MMFKINEINRQKSNSKSIDFHGESIPKISKFKNESELIVKFDNSFKHNPLITKSLNPDIFN